MRQLTLLDVVTAAARHGVAPRLKSLHLASLRGVRPPHHNCTRERKADSAMNCIDIRKWNGLFFSILSFLLKCRQSSVTVVVTSTAQNFHSWYLVWVEKKLRYREEHSASVVLSWCTSWHFAGQNLLMANQPLLRNWPRKLPNAAK